MKLSLNESWSFNRTHKTTVKIEIQSDSAIGDAYRDLLVSFSQLNRSYISSIIQIDTTDDHLIYPQCQIYPNKQEIANGDINKILQNGSDRIQQALHNTTHYMQPYDSSPNVAYPLTYILQNDPLDNCLSFTYTNPNATARTCSYTQLEANAPLDIYFAVAEQAHQFDILSFSITHWVDIPTPSPTEQPTDVPTANEIELRIPPMTTKVDMNGEVKETEIVSNKDIAELEEEGNDTVDEGQLFMKIITVSISTCLCCCFVLCVVYGAQMIARGNVDVSHLCTDEIVNDSAKHVSPEGFHVPGTPLDSVHEESFEIIGNDEEATKGN